MLSLLHSDIIAARAWSRVTQLMTQGGEKQEEAWTEPCLSKLYPGTHSLLPSSTPPEGLSN